MSGSANRLLATVFGVVYLLVGALGFAVTGFADFAGTEGETLIVFDVNPLHNVVHLAVGAVLLAAGRTVRSAPAANTAVGAVYLAVGAAGLFLVGTEANIIALNGADNVLHFASALLLLGVGLGADKRATAPA
jgi:hypothetical protein